MPIRLIGYLLTITACLMTNAQAESSDIQPITITIESSAMSQSRELRVLLPDGYEVETKAKYPVVYVLDAEENLHHAWATGRFLSHYRNMPKVIVVGLVQENRLHDLTPDDNPDAINTFSTFLEKEAIPLVKKRFRTEDFSILTGHSLGGLLALTVLAENPDLFDAYFAFSPSTWWADGQVVGAVTRAFNTPMDKKHYLYMNLGTEGARMQSGFDTLSTFLSQTKPEHVINIKAHSWLRNGNNDDKAIALFATNIQRFPESHVAQGNMAIAYEQLERFNLAKSHIKQALSLLDEQHSDYAEFKRVEDRIDKKLAFEQAPEK